MKKIILSVLTSMLTTAFVAGQAHAAKTEAVDDSENVLRAHLMEQVLNSIDKASLDININDLSIVKEGEDDKTKVLTNDVTVGGIIGFGSDWSVDLVKSSQDDKADPQLAKLYPKLAANAGNLNLAVNLVMHQNIRNLTAKFFGGYDKKTKQWQPRPLILKVTNQLNKSLLTIRIHSLTAKETVSATNDKEKTIEGTCESDKVLFDFVTGENRQVPVDCRFEGTMTEKTPYKLKFKYATKMP